MEDATNGRCHDEFRQKFTVEILKSECSKSTHFNVLTKEQYSKLINEVEEAEQTKEKTTLQRRRLKRFNVVEINGIKKLIARNVEDGGIKHFLIVDEIYDALQIVHVKIGHGGRDRMLAECSKIYGNVTKDMVCLFLSMCEICQQKKTKGKGLIPQTLNLETLSRCQLEFIDFRINPDNGLNYVMIYQDYHTKFILLKPLKTLEAQEVAYHLNDIFLTIGAPCILDLNDRELNSNVIKELTVLSPELKIVSGSGSLETTHDDIKGLINSWLNDHNATGWSESLRYVQFERNRTFHSNINQCPYKAMFGTEPKMGLSTSTIPDKLLRTIRDEEELQALLRTQAFDCKDKKSFDVKNAKKRKAESFGSNSKMSRSIDQIYAPAKVGDNVLVIIPNTNDDIKTVGVILEVNEEGLYKIGTKNGVLDGLYHRNEFDLCAPKYIQQEIFTT